MANEILIPVYINGMPESIHSELSIANLLKIKNMDQGYLAVALNEEIIRKAQYGDTYLKAGDRLEILHPVGGG